MFTLTPGLLSVASDSINEPSASHLSVAKLYTIECEPVTFDAAFECVPTPVNDLVSIPNPPVVGSVDDVPVSIKVSSTSNLAVFNIVSAPLTVKSPVIVRSPGIVTVSLEALPNVVLPFTAKLPDISVLPVISTPSAAVANFALPLWNKLTAPSPSAVIIFSELSALFNLNTLVRTCKLSVLDITLLVLSLNICNSSELPSSIFSLYPKSNLFAFKANVVLLRLVIVPEPRLPLDLNVDEVNVSVGSLTSKSKF